jgi:hypothetical protein
MSGGCVEEESASLARDRSAAAAMAEALPRSGGERNLARRRLR